MSEEPEIEKKPQIMSDYQLEFCQAMMNKIRSKAISGPFLKPFDNDLKFGYISPNNNPMDLTKVQENLDANKYDSIFAWAKDVNLIWKNARDSYQGTNPIGMMATDLQQWFNKRCNIDSKKSEPVCARYAEELWERRLSKLKDKIKQLERYCPLKKELLPEK